MQKDFHYYALAVLAKVAGFSEADALIIAYASQFVDDNNLNRLDIADPPEHAISTAHTGIDILQTKTQIEGCVPFHFIPPFPICKGRESYITVEADPENSPLVYQLLDQVRTSFDLSANEQERVFSLCSLGIALHTFADSWAHQHFSGRMHHENDVENIWVLEAGEWEHLLLKNVCYDILPKIGHAQAGYFPDLPYQVWRYTNANGQIIERDNCALFLDAAKAVFALLCSFANAKQEVDSALNGSITMQFRTLFEQYGSLEERCIRWQSSVRELRLFDQSIEYDPDLWKNQYISLPARAKNGTCLSNFYEAAQKQRDFVLSNIYL